MTAEELKDRIEQAIKQYTEAADDDEYDLVPHALTSGKLYEAHVLSLVLERLHVDEGMRIALVNDGYVHLKSAPGPINHDYPHFDVFRGDDEFGELWTDVEFLSLSSSQRPPDAERTRGDYHELDLALVSPGAAGRPRHNQILLAVECKNTDYGKSLLREILGVRRELSLLRGVQPTQFVTWPRQHVPADPPSCVLVYTTDPGVADYDAPGEVFGINFYHEAL